MEEGRKCACLPGPQGPPGPPGSDGNITGKVTFMGDFSPHKSQMMSPRKISDDVFVGKNQIWFKE